MTRNDLIVVEFGDAGDVLIRPEVVGQVGAAIERIFNHILRRTPNGYGDPELIEIMLGTVERGSLRLGFLARSKNVLDRENVQRANELYDLIRKIGKDVVALGALWGVFQLPGKIGEEVDKAFQRRWLIEEHDDVAREYETLARVAITAAPGQVTLSVPDTPTVFIVGMNSRDTELIGSAYGILDKVGGIFEGSLRKLQGPFPLRNVNIIAETEVYVGEIDLGNAPSRVMVSWKSKRPASSAIDSKNVKVVGSLRSINPSDWVSDVPIGFPLRSVKAHFIVEGQIVAE